jgi:cytochrome c-type biogenesis protein CcmF
MGTSRELQLRAGESATIGSYSLTFVEARQVSEPHRRAQVAVVSVSRNGKDLGAMLPRMNQYDTQREPVGTPAVRTFLLEDLYLSILNIDTESGTVDLHALVNPMVAWIWAATGLMALGGLIALVPRRRTDAVGVRAAVMADSGGYGAAAPQR